MSSFSRAVLYLSSLRFSNFGPRFSSVSCQCPVKIATRAVNSYLQIPGPNADIDFRYLYVRNAIGVDAWNYFISGVKGEWQVESGKWRVESGEFKGV